MNLQELLEQFQDAQMMRDRGSWSPDIFAYEIDKLVAVLEEIINETEPKPQQEPSTAPDRIRSDRLGRRDDYLGS